MMMNDILQSIQHYEDVGAFDQENDIPTDDYVMQENLANFRASQENALPISKLEGEVNIAVRINNYGEYLKWKQWCEPGRKWETILQYPVFMRVTKKFRTVQHLQMIMNEIVGLLQRGFDVYSANWKLKEESDEVAMEKEEG